MDCRPLIQLKPLVLAQSVMQQDLSVGPLERVGLTRSFSRGHKS